MTQPQQPIAYGCYRHPDRPTYIRCQRCGRPICGDCMISAAVGFQCPDCVAEFAKQTRQHEGPFGGTRSTNPRLTTIVLIAINVAVWLGIFLTGGSSSRLASLLALTPAGQCSSLSQPGAYYPGVGEIRCAVVGDGSWLPGVAQGEYWQLLTSAFTHIELMHLAMNMISLWFLGPPMEAALGRARFLAVYLLSALTGSLAVMWFSEPTTMTLGASGAVFGLIGSLIVVGLKVKADLRIAFTWLGINLIYTFLNSGVSWQGHIGGLLGGMAATAIIVYAPRKDRTRIQWIGLAALAALTLVATAVRVAQLA